MPESSSSAEIEYVLASIRRLIGEGRPEGPSPPGPLVLTPALRVERAPDLPPPSGAGSTPDAPRPAAEPLVLYASLANVAAPVPPAMDGTDTRRAGDATPDASGSGDGAPAEREEAVTMADPRPDPSAALVPDPSGPALAEQPRGTAAWSDEAALRALVAEVLHEELRGELGERLTRNLRKLVRREVMQALAARGTG